MAYALVAQALLASSTSEAIGGLIQLKIRSHCIHTRCGSLPPEQWRVETRRWFKESLARIQVELVNTVRGTANTPSEYYGIPEPYRGMCGMSKFKSVGWCNVSVWGLPGLLSLAANISLASVKTKEEELWLSVGARAVKDLLLWSVGKARQIPWKLLSGRIRTKLG